jgi:hypothetical protein
VIRHYILQEIEPEQSKSGEHLTLPWNSVWHHHVESRNAIGGDNQQRVVDRVYVSNFAATE